MLRALLARRSSRGIQRNCTDGSAESGGKLVVSGVGVHLAGVQLVLQHLLLKGESDSIGTDPLVAQVDSPIRRDAPAVSVSGLFDVIELALACAHVRLGARHRGRHLFGFRAVCFDVAANLAHVDAKSVPRLTLPVGEDVVGLLQAVPQTLQGISASAGRLEHRADRVEIPALDVSRSQRSHPLPLLLHRLERAGRTVLVRGIADHRFGDVRTQPAHPELVLAVPGLPPGRKLA